MARLLETDSNTNKDISSAVSIGSYTATAVRTVMVRVLINQVAGNGDYVAYLTLTKSTVEYRIIPLTTAAAASGLTAIGFVSIGIPVDVDDVLQVYMDGLAGDNSTPDTRVDWYEMDYLRPTVSGRTLDVTATGAAGVDWGNVENPTTALNLSGTSTKANESAPPTAIENADALLKRDWTAVTGEAARSVLNALRFLRNKWSISGTTLTVTEEDDSTEAWTAALTATEGADPITAVDPAGPA